MWRHSLTIVAVMGVLCATAWGGETPAPVPEPGRVLWFDLVTDDAAAAIPFYRDLFGWQVESVRPDTYLARRDGHPVAGIHQIKRDDPNVDDSLWLVGIETEDVRAALERAKHDGAEVHLEVREAPGYGFYAVISDPQGAPVMLVQPERVFEHTSGPNRWIWAELWTRDLDAAAKFYADVVGYTRQEIERPRGPYETFALGGRPRAGLVRIPTDRPEIAPAWAPYVAVEDLKATQARVQELGGTVLVAPRPDFGGGVVELIEDPSGAAFFVYQIPAGVK